MSDNVPIRALVGCDVICFNQGVISNADSSPELTEAAAPSPGGVARCANAQVVAGGNLVLLC